MAFWIYIFLVNVIIFLPFYFLNFKIQPNPIHFLTAMEFGLEDRIKIPYAKLTSDPFRIHFEFTALLLVFKYLNIVSIWALALCTLIGFIGWILIIYSGIMHYIFYRPPVFRSDWQLIKIGLKMTYSQRYLIYSGIIMLTLFMIGVCFYCSTLILNTDVEINYIPWVLLVLSPLAWIKSHRIKYSKFINRTVLSTVMYAYRNWRNSRQYYFPLNKDQDYYLKTSPCQSLSLRERPNFNMICIEAYGSVIFQNEKMRNKIVPLLKSFEHKLKLKGYSIVSGFSTSPLIGGGSWKCYSSFTYGMRIDDDSLYNLLFKDIDNFKSYKSIFHLFKDEGYTNYLLCPMGDYEDGVVDWDMVQRNMQSDVYLEYEDMKFTGHCSRFFGDTKIPPDQYSINKAAEIIKSNALDPYFLFYISLNSHYPFSSPTKVVDDWRTLNDKEIDIGLMEKRSEKLGVMYVKAIAYQLELFLRHIEESEEPLFVLFGDHQPPRIKLNNGSKETPVHIIAKNRDFINPFIAQGFEKGLVPSMDASRKIKHEGFLSQFAAAMQASYGHSTDCTVAYQPNGVIFNKDS